MAIYEKNYVVTNPLIQDNFKYVCISDIHSNVNNLLLVIERIKNINPDFVIIAGDLVDMLDNPDNELLLEPLIYLNQIIPIYVGFGNSDITFRKLNHEDSYFFSILKENGITILGNNKSTRYKDITISSFNLSNNKWYLKDEDKSVFDIELVTNCKRTSGFDILICHSPNALVSDNNIRDLISEVLPNTLINSGHNHGGFINPKLQKVIKSRKGFFGPNGKLFNPNSFGTLTKDNTSLIINDGVTKYAPSKIGSSTLKDFINKSVGISLDVIEVTNGLNHSCVYKSLKK